MSILDRRIARLELALEATDIKDVARMTREEREKLMVEIFTPYIGEERARAHVHRLRTDPAYFREVDRVLREVCGAAGHHPLAIAAGTDHSLAHRTQRRRTAMACAINLSRSSWLL